MNRGWSAFWGVFFIIAVFGMALIGCGKTSESSSENVSESRVESSDTEVDGKAACLNKCNMAHVQQTADCSNRYSSVTHCQNPSGTQQGQDDIMKCVDDFDKRMHDCNTNAFKEVDKCRSSCK